MAVVLFPALILSCLSLTALGCAAPPLTDLQAQSRDGQVFLTWQETPGWQGSVTVLASPQPITTANAPQATVLAAGLSPGSAYDWWLNPETFGNPVAVDPATGQKPPFTRTGFLIAPGSPRLNPDTGLHVHTPARDETGPRYYAVVVGPPDQATNWEIRPGVNALTEPVEVPPAPIRPIWQNAAPAPDPASGRGKPLHLVLHAKTGRGGMDYLVFGDKSLGWREGLPFKFGVQVTDQAVIVTPTDRTWIDRMFPEGKDSCQQLTPAIHSFWYGYNENIRWPEKMASGTVVNYTERRLLWIVDWVQRTYQTDPHRTYATGSSMGGCGSISFALRHPEIFAAIRAHVPIVAYDRGPGGDSTVRVVAETGGMERPTNEGLTVQERLDGTAFVKRTTGDLPFLVITNGRTDRSIPWWKCPDFYRALRDGRHAFVAAWDNGDHAGCGKDMPADVRAYNNLTRFHALFALNQSYLAFANSSADNDPGNGDAANGDLEGAMNRGLSWETPTDTPERYEVVVTCQLEANRLPVTVDITPRRLQRFRLRPGEEVLARNLTADGVERQRQMLTADALGLVTMKGFRLETASQRLVLTRP